ncbi:ATP-dependent DNA helicase [Trichonephila inaurata madagascariensis]|uniref:ATP-dependent DNA helicase n=1 Tax=Trichonephila inaurata madagascariensis TaxID=2747483 RepID=A0A8X6Y469_9ARAC|nr:ATP-dependent DNA helicase [Trichonephila inaurata madagascariensis]
MNGKGLSEKKGCFRLSGNPERSGFGKSIYCTHPGNAECYYLRLLLHKIPGPASFTALKIVAGVVQPSFQAACKALGLLEDDVHWNSTSEKASISEYLNKIRELFAIILVFCQVGDPIKLWVKRRDSLSEDFKNQLKQSKEISINILILFIINVSFFLKILSIYVG